MTDELKCRFCGRPCANGTGRAAHERHCSQRDSPAVCKRCHEDYPRGELEAHLKVCSASATSKLDRSKPARPRLLPPSASTEGLVITITITGSPREVEDALRRLRS